MAQKLPVQCLQFIFSQLAFFSIRCEAGRIKCDNRLETKTDLATCVLVCRTWAAPANEALYKVIYGSYLSTRRVGALLETIEHTPFLAGLIQVLNVHEASQELARSEVRRDQLKRILQAVPNLQFYAVRIQRHALPFCTTVLPTPQNSRLKTLALSVSSKVSVPSFGERTFENLPKSIENVFLDIFHGFTVQLSLPKLRQLRLSQSWRFRQISLENSVIVTRLCLSEPSPRDLNNILTSIGCNLKYLHIESWTRREEVYRGALPDYLEFLGPNAQMDPNTFSSNVQVVTWKFMTRARVFEMLRLLRNPDYLPNLRSIPALYWCLSGVNCMQEGEYSLSEYKKLGEQAFETLRFRGLSRPISRETEVLDPTRAFPVFDATLGA